jgi:hypothetical protein
LEVFVLLAFLSELTGRLLLYLGMDLSVNLSVQNWGCFVAKLWEQDLNML